MATAIHNLPRLPSQEVLKSVLHYDPETGKFSWKERDLSFFVSRKGWAIWNARYAGKEAFTALLKGYHQGRLFDRFCAAHRIAWKIVNGDEPDEIDHVNGIRSDNRLCNLRAVDRSRNMKNSAIWSHNTSGHCGVTWHKRNQKWQAQINSKGRSHHLGLFTNIEDAIAARKAAEVKFGFHMNHGRQPPSP